MKVERRRRSLMEDLNLCMLYLVYVEEHSFGVYGGG